MKRLLNLLLAAFLVASLVIPVLPQREAKAAAGQYVIYLTPSTNVTDTMINFPVKVHFTDDWFDFTGFDPLNLQFRASDNTTILNADNASWNGSNDFTAWVSCNFSPDLPYSSQYIIADKNASSNWMPTLVWGAVNAVSVWHLDSYSSNLTTVYDFTGGGYHLTSTNTTWSATTGRGFAGVSNSYLLRSTANYRSTDNTGSIFAWVNTANPALGDLFMTADEAVANKFLTNRLQQLSGASYTNGVLHQNTAGQSTVRGDLQVNDGNEHQTVFLSNGALWAFYRDSAQLTPTITAGTNNGQWFDDITARDNIIIGGFKYTSTFSTFNGTMREVQVYSDNKSINYITSMYQNMANTLTLHGGESLTYEKKYSPQDLNSPFRNLSFTFNHSAVATNTTYKPILTLEEGAFNKTDVGLTLSWNGTHVQAVTRSYADNATISTNTSAIAAIVSGNSVSITSNTTGTYILVNGVAMTFGGAGSSPIYTNTYNWVRFHPADVEYTIANLVVGITPIVDTTTLYARLVSVLDATTYPGNAYDSSAIYEYLLNGDAAALATAKNAVDNIVIPSASVVYTPEVALLCIPYPAYVTNLNTMATSLWAQVQPNLLYPTNSPTDNTSFFGGGSFENSQVIRSFVIGGIVSNNDTMKNMGYAVYDAVWNNMRQAGTGTIITSVNAQTLAVVTNTSRVGDQNANFIDLSLWLYDITGNVTFRDKAAYIASQYIAYAWDSVNQRFTYQQMSSDPGFEAFTYVMSSALVELSDATGSSNWTTSYAYPNYKNTMEEMRRNNLTNHYWEADGRFGHDSGYLVQEAVRAAALISKYVTDTDLNTLAEEYADTLVRYYLTDMDRWGLVSTNFTESATFQSVNYRLQNIAAILDYFIRPTSGVTVSYENGRPLYSKYLGLSSFPQDVHFASANVTLDDVSGSGNITFGDGINYVYLNDATYLGAQFTVPASHIFPYPPTLPTVTTGTYAKFGGNSAILNGNVTNMGVSTDTWVSFDWGYTAAYGSSTTETSQAAIGSYTKNITYDPLREVHYRAVTRVGTVYSYGSDQTIPIDNTVDTSVLFIIPLGLLLIVFFASGAGLEASPISIIVVIIIIGTVIQMLANLFTSLF